LQFFKEAENPCVQDLLGASTELLHPLALVGSGRAGSRDLLTERSQLEGTQRLSENSLPLPFMLWLVGRLEAFLMRLVAVPWS
jgi:hypothetical protein